LQFSVDNLAFCIFCKQVLKSYLALQCLLFIAPVLGGQCEFVCLLAVFVAGHSNFFFMQTVFTFSNSIRFSIHCALSFIYSSINFCRSALHGVLCKAGRTLSCPGSGKSIWLLFRAGRALLGFWLLPFTFLSLIGSGSGAGR
jgi:hypothetical protein